MKGILGSLSILSIITCSALNVNAQQMYLGARIGANLANQTTESLFSGTSLGISPGLLIGSQFDYWFDSSEALCAQILYYQRGAKESFGESGTDFSDFGTNELMFNYLEIPIFVKVTFGTGNIRPYIFAGPSIGFFLSGSQRINSTISVNGNSTTTDSTKSVADSTVKSPDISAVFGAGISVMLSSGQILFLDAGYALGLVNIYDGSNTTNSRDIRIAAGILFPLN